MISNISYKDWLLVVVVLFFSLVSSAQVDSVDAKTYKKRMLWVGGVTSVSYAANMTMLYQLWYADFNSGSFHTFDDSDEWRQLDKIGHGYTAYHVHRAYYHILQTAGMSKQQARWWGAVPGFAFMSTIEVFDGYSQGWGFSWSDVAANITGSGLLLGQTYLNNPEDLTLKFSYSESEFRSVRPAIFGDNAAQGLVKDYNGQTYWIGYSPFHLEKNKWLNAISIAGGYGIQGMLTARTRNSIFLQDCTNCDFDENPIDIGGYNLPARQYYLSLDINWEKIETNKKGLRILFKTLNIIKLPFPAFQYNKHDGFLFLPLHF